MSVAVVNDRDRDRSGPVESGRHLAGLRVDLRERLLAVQVLAAGEEPQPLAGERAHRPATVDRPITLTLPLARNRL
jgi:hypothetical protein